MRFQLLGGWPVGQFLIDQDFVIRTNQGNVNYDGSIDTTQPQWAFLIAPGGPMANGRPPPPNARAMDQLTYQVLVAAYGYHVAQYGPGVVPATH